jgi:hypothetical protein
MGERRRDTQDKQRLLSIFLHRPIPGLLSMGPVSDRNSPEPWDVARASIKNGTRHLGFFSLGNLLGQKEEIKAVSNGRIDILCIAEPRYIDSSIRDCFYFFFLPK